MLIEYHWISFQNLNEYGDSLLTFVLCWDESFKISVVEALNMVVKTLVITLASHGKVPTFMSWFHVLSHLLANDHHVVIQVVEYLLPTCESQFAFLARWLGLTNPSHWSIWVVKQQMKALSVSAPSFSSSLTSWLFLLFKQQKNKQLYGYIKSKVIVYSPYFQGSSEALE